MGAKNWNNQYGKSKNQYDVLPCCCGMSPCFNPTFPHRTTYTYIGPDCSLTANFTKAANMHNFQTLLYGCKAQLKNDPDLNFDKIDYGFKMKKSLPLWWATLSKGQKAGVAIGIVFGGFLAVVVMVSCCACIRGG
jgi:hypothetical protein